MCGGEHAQWAVLLRRVIEVDSQGHNLGKSICWSVCVDDAIFYGPRSPALRFPLIAKRQGSILMPDHEPLRIVRFVK
jgi:hypothetical protein